jgi:hypothetical protein
MSKLAQLRAQRAAKAKEANELNNKYPADQRMLAADADRLDAILAEVETIDNEIAREARIAQLAMENPQAQHDALLNAATREPGKQGEEGKALRAFLAGGLMNMSEGDRQRMLARQNPDIRNAMSTTTPSEGGYTTAIEYQKQLEAAMKAFGGMRGVASQIRTATGITMNFPTADATAEIGEIVGQSVAATWAQITQVLDSDSTGGDQQFTTYSFLEDATERQIPTNKSAQGFTLDLGDDASLPWFDLLSAADDDKLPRAIRISLSGGGVIYYNCFCTINKTPSLKKNEVAKLRATFSLVADVTRYVS